MIASDLQSGVEQLGDLIACSSIIVPFTGAGISTECGIPDFRSPGGLWTRNRPIPFDEFVASQDARDESWRRRFAMEATFAAAKYVSDDDPKALWGWIIFPKGFRAPAMMELAKRQAWTLKPALLDRNAE